ncbi:MAG: hypothetical protein NTV34_18410 [Proteobacteria bacterium]|nr:hypothetical protein [Pseudomonadota bacterium]
MKTLLIGKLVLIVTAMALYQGWITIGDLALLAEEPPKPSESAATTRTKETAVASAAGPVKGEPQPPSATADLKGPNGENIAAEVAKEGPGSEDKVSDDPAAKSRRSFLAELFELPTLDPKSARKEEVGKYLDMADRKEKQIKNREAMLARREIQLKAIEKSIDEKLVKMDEERSFIAKTLQQEKDLKGERLDKLITLYDKMEPKKAAPQIEKLDKDLVVGLFKGLKQKQVTTILESMSPEKGVEITEYFGRVKSGREYDLLKELNSSLRKEFTDCKGMPPGDGTLAEKTIDKSGDSGKAKPSVQKATKLDGKVQDEIAH